MEVMDSKKDKGRKDFCAGPILMSSDGTIAHESIGNQEETSPKTGSSESPSGLNLGSFFNFRKSTSPPKGSPKSPSGAKAVQLFGNAITCSLPSTFEDISVVRQVPDHQEVYVDRASEMSFIIELLAYESDVPDHKAAVYFFDDLAKFNEASTMVIDTNELVKAGDHLPLLGHECTKCILRGRQAVKPQAAAPAGSTVDVPTDHIDLVHTILMAVRLPEVRTDLLISLNLPMHHVSAAAPALDARLSAQPSASHMNPLETVYQKICTSLEIKDWSLFV